VRGDCVIDVVADADTAHQAVPNASTAGVTSRNGEVERLPHSFPFVIAVLLYAACEMS
jgi:hypothetical protein